MPEPRRIVIHRFLYRDQGTDQTLSTLIADSVLACPSSMKRASDIAYRPSNAGTKGRPSNKSGVNANRGVPFSGSMPMTGKTTPIHSASRPRNADLPPRLLTRLNPNTPNAQYSVGPNSRANSDRGTAVTMSSNALSNAPMPELIIDICNANPASPCFAMG